MTALVLEDNRIADAGALALAEAIKLNIGLRQLDLTLNHIGEVGTAAIKEALVHNTKINCSLSDPYKVVEEETPKVVEPAPKT